MPSDFVEEMKPTEGLCFDCNGCSQCCRFEGGVVLLSDYDLKQLSDWAELTPEQFTQVYCRWLQSNDGTKYLALRDKSNSGDCIFWDGSIPGCQAYPSRPTQCRTYPFWTNVLSSKERWDLEQKDCPGINCGKLHPRSEILEQLSLYESRDPLTNASCNVSENSARVPESSASSKTNPDGYESSACPNTSSTANESSACPNTSARVPESEES